MPKYTVQDDTGKTITFDWQGEGEPTDADFDEVFKSAREYVSEKNKPSEAPTMEELQKEAGPRILPMLKNLPESTLNLGLGMAQTLGNIPGTMKALGQTVAGGIEKATGMGTGEHISNWDAFTQSMKDRYGSLGNLYNTMETDPAGFMTDVSTVLGGAGAITKSGALSRAGKVTNILYGGGKALGKGIGKLEDVAVGGLSGTSVGTVNKARQWSKDFQTMLRGNMSGQDMVGMIKDSLKTLGDAEYARYSQKLGQIDNLGVVVDTNEIFNRYDELLKSIRVKRNVDGSLDFAGSNLERQKPMQAELNKINKYLLDRTVGGIPYGMLPSEVDAMKKWIWTERGAINPKRNAPVKNLAEQLYGATEQTLEKQVPTYADMVKDSKKYLAWQDEFEKAFSMGDKTNIETTISKFRNATNKDKEFRIKLVKDFKDLTGIDLEAMISGYSMQDFMPRGLYGRSMATAMAIGGYKVNPALWGGLAFTSPRLAGEMMQVQGLAGKALSKVPSQVPNLLYQAGQVEQRPKSVLYGGE